MRLWTLVFLAAVTIMAVAAHAEMYVRVVQLTPQVNWTGLVLLEMPEALIDGAAGVYVSNVSDCSIQLPTFWTIVGDIAYVVFDPGMNLTNGTRYTWYLCYGDVVVENNIELASCRLPDGCSIAYTEHDAILDEHGVIIDFNNQLNVAEREVEGNGSTRYRAELIDSGPVYLANASARFTTMVRQDYRFRVLDNGSVVYQAPMQIVDRTVVKDDTVDYDTGLHYYDTGVVTVYDAGRDVYVESGYITIDVYDSDRDTYYVYVYINGEEVASFYEQSTVNFSLSGRWLRTVAVRVYDTERNDWVRASGSVRIVVYNYTYEAASGELGRLEAPVALVVRGASEFNIDGVFRVEYYTYSMRCGSVEFNATQFLAVLYTVRFNYTSGNFTAGTSYAYAAVKLGDQVLTAAGALLETDSYGSPLHIAVTPDAASMANLETGALLGVIADDYPIDTENATLSVCVYDALPARYAALFEQLLVFEALSNYTDYYVSGAYTPTVGGGGGGAGNASIVVTVEQTTDPELKLLATVLVVVAGIGFGLYSFHRSIKTNENIWIAMSILGFTTSSLAAFTMGYYDTARFLLALNLLALYPVVERAMDMLLRAAARRRR